MRDTRNLYRAWGRTPPKQGDDAPRLLWNELATSTSGQAKLYLYGPIDSWGGYWGVSAAEFATVLNELDNDVTDLELHINSPGGEVYEGIAIMNLLKNHSAKVTAVVDGIAASAASFIACGMNELVMGENTELMIHDAWGFAIGNAKDMHDYGDYLSNTSDNIASVYAKKAGGTRDSWREYMQAESWFSAEEAVSNGLADRVSDSAEDDDTETDALSNRVRFDTAALFEHPSRAHAPAPAPVPVAVAVDDTPPAGVDLSLRHRLNARKIGAGRA